MQPRALRPSTWSEHKLTPIKLCEVYLCKYIHSYLSQVFGKVCLYCLQKTKNNASSFLFRQETRHSVSPSPSCICYLRSTCSSTMGLFSLEDDCSLSTELWSTIPLDAPLRYKSMTASCDSTVDRACVQRQIGQETGGIQTGSIRSKQFQESLE